MKSWFSGLAPPYRQQLMGCRSGGGVKAKRSFTLATAIPTAMYMHFSLSDASLYKAACIQNLTLEQLPTVSRVTSWSLGALDHSLWTPGPFSVLVCISSYAGVVVLCILV